MMKALSLRFGFGLAFFLLFTPAVFALTSNATAVTQNRQAIRAYIKTINPMLSSENSTIIADRLAEAGNTLTVDPKFVAAIVAVESKFNPRAYNHGAAGLGQLMPGTARHVGVNNPFSITENALGTTQYVRSQMDYFGTDSNQNIVLASYLQGPMMTRRQRGKFPNRVYRYISSVMTHYAAISEIFKSMPNPAPTLATASNIQNTPASPTVPTASLLIQ